MSDYTDEQRALAESMAKLDRKLPLFVHERDEQTSAWDTDYTGCYDGYMAEADEMIRNLKYLGFKIVPIGD